MFIFIRIGLADDIVPNEKKRSKILPLVTLHKWFSLGNA